MWWPHGDAREKGRVITARRERPGLTSAGSPLLQPFHPADHGDLSSLICAGPARLLLESVCPFQPGCGFGSERPDCCHLNGSCLCLPKPCAPTITPSLPWASLAGGAVGWGVHTSGLLLELLPNQFITAAHRNLSNMQNTGWVYTG